MERRNYKRGERSNGIITGSISPRERELILVCHASEARALHQPDILRERSAIRLVRRHLPRLAPRGERILGKIHTPEVLLRVDRNAIPALTQRDWPTFPRLWRDMPDDESV